MANIPPVITTIPSRRHAAADRPATCGQPTLRRQIVGHLNVPLLGIQMSHHSQSSGTSEYPVVGHLDVPRRNQGGTKKDGTTRGPNSTTCPRCARATLWTHSAQQPDNSPKRIHQTYNSTMPSSALRKTGSTREWRRLRIPLLAALARNGYLNCAAQRSPRCLITITRPADLVAGHVVARTHGGTDAQLQPECRPCSDHQGGQLAHQQQTAPERKW